MCGTFCRMSGQCTFLKPVSVPVSTSVILNIRAQRFFPAQDRIVHLS
jgi:hypothetical protein